MSLTAGQPKAATTAPMAGAGQKADGPRGDQRHAAPAAQQRAHDAQHHADQRAHEAQAHQLAGADAHRGRFAARGEVQLHFFPGTW
jgi:hypothetical protein